MSWTQHEVTTADGAALAEYRWPVDDAVAEVVLFHGLAEHLGRYDHVAAALNDAGIGVRGVDIRGHGRSPVDLRSLESYRLWLHDHASYVDGVAAESDAPVFVIGHSLGGCLALTLAGEGRLQAEGLVTSGAAVRVSEDLAPLVRRVAGVLSRLTPSVALPAGLADAICRDPAVVESYVNDPLVHQKVPARIGAEAIALIEDCEDRLSGVELPVLVLHGSADGITDVAGQDVIESHIASDDATFRVLDGWYHELFNEPGHEELIADVIAWILERTPAA